MPDLTLTVPEDVCQSLEFVAERLGISFEELVLRLLTEAARPTS